MSGNDAEYTQSETRALDTRPTHAIEGFRKPEQALPSHRIVIRAKNNRDVLGHIAAFVHSLPDDFPVQRITVREFPK